LATAVSGLDLMKAGDKSRRGSQLFLLAALLLLAGTLSAHASIAVLLEEPYGLQGRFNPSGHAAVYLDHVCAATPVSLRRCRAGEQGSVLSRYDGIGRRDWVAMPLIGYLYAVGQPADIAVSVSRSDVARLREAYRRENFRTLIPDMVDGSPPTGNWYQLAGAAFDRTIYGFQVKTTAAQDDDLIAFLNDHGNEDKYNGAFRNCADFVRVAVNLFYPHAIRRNYVADLGLTSPKSVARGLAHYAATHPEVGLTVFRVEQISGDLPRSHAPVTLFEGIVKEFGVPLAIFLPVTTGAMVAAYVGHGRFAEPKDAPVLNLRTDVLLAGGLNLRTAATDKAGEQMMAEGPK